MYVYRYCYHIPTFYMRYIIANKKEAVRERQRIQICTIHLFTREGSKKHKNTYLINLYKSMKLHEMT